MTVSDDFIPNDFNETAAPAYPTVFGIAITPAIGGALLALLGLGAAGALWFYLLQPEIDKNAQLEQQVKDKNAQVAQQGQILKQVAKAREDLETAKRQRQEVQNLFASDATLSTLVLDINKQITDRSRGVESARQAKLAQCPGFVRDNLTEIEEQVGSLVAAPRLLKFTPDPKASGIITDSSYSATVNNKLKRQVAAVSLEGNYDQVQSIMRSLERLQPLLVFKNFQAVSGKGGQVQTTVGTPSGVIYESIGNIVRPVPNCQPESILTTTFQLEALQPLSPDEAKAINTPPPPPKK